MQTRLPGLFAGWKPKRAATAKPALARRAAAAILCVTAALPLSGCAVPRLASRVEAQSRPGSCEVSYKAAEAQSAVMGADDGTPMIMRLLAGREAQQQWFEVAATCPGRFSEGTIRAAQTWMATARLGDALGTGTPRPSVALDDVIALKVPAKALRDMALAEDRLGFETQILAARAGAPGGTPDGSDAGAPVTEASLAGSDRNKADAARLMTLSRTRLPASGPTDDPRRKVYDVGELLAHPDTIVDPATGLEAGTFAVATMNCAREELAAMDGVTGGAPSMAVLSRLICGHITDAFAAGYPSFDHALFAAGSGSAEAAAR